MTRTQQVYGGSLYELALEEGLTGEILEQLRQVVALFDENPDYWRFLSTLSIPKDDRCGALDEAFRDRLHPYLLNFMKILCENGTIMELRGCAAEFRSRYYADNGIVEVCAVTAVPMKQPLRDRLLEKLQSTLGKKVELRFRVDPACIGGVLLELPGRQMDGTVKQRLDSLAASLSAASV